MNQIPMLPADTFTVINRTIMHNSDRNILIMLYQPIIGSNAINLYLTLWSYLNKSEIMSLDWTHHHLMSSMQINLDKIIESREKLEAIGLIKSYIKEDKEKNINSYVYELYSPLRVYDFLIDPILSTILHDSVGDIEYKNIKEYFKMPNINLNDYKDITSKFNDVFMTTSMVNIDNIEEIKKVNRLGIAYEPTIDLNTVLGMIPKELLNIRSINNQTKDLIYKLALVYNYDDSQMKEVIVNSIDDSHRIDLDKLKITASKLYKFENNNSSISLLYKNQPEYLRNKNQNISSKAKMIYTFETTSPYDFLASKSGCELTKGEVEILKYLLIDIGLTTGVVNVLIDYVLKTSENKLVKSYIESKAIEWKRNNIKTVEDAMELAKKDKVNRKVTKTKTVEKPVWFNQNIEGEEASDEEQKAFLEKLQKMEVKK